MSLNPIQIVFDSNEVLYSITFDDSRAEYLEDFEVLKHIVLNKKLDSILSSSFDEMSQTLTSVNLVNFLKLAIFDYRGDSFIIDSLGEHQKELICRCNHLFKSDLKKIYKEVKGVRKEFFKNSNASLICGNCKDEVDELVCSMKNDLYEGQTLELFKSQVIEELENFPMYSPQDFQGITLELMSIAPGKLRVKARRGQLKTKREKIHKILLEYLDPKLTQLFDISIIVSE